MLASNSVRSGLSWAALGLLVFSGLVSGIATVAYAQPVAETFARLDLPPRLAPLMGVAKVMGAVALLVPRSPRVHEWAYAGFVFAMLGAVYLHVTGGDGLAETAGPLTILILAVASYLLDRRTESSSDR